MSLENRGGRGFPGQRVAVGLPTHLSPVASLSAGPTPTGDSAADWPGKTGFEGRISRSGERLVLEAKAEKISYQLDDQQLAGLFEGKDVKITGRLDSESNTIYISDIGLLNAKRSA